MPAELTIVTTKMIDAYAERRLSAEDCVLVREAMILDERVRDAVAARLVRRGADPAESSS